MLKIGSGLKQFDLKFVRVQSVFAGSSSVSSMIRVGYDSDRSFLVWVISVKGYVSVTKIGYSSGPAFSFSVVNRFRCNFDSGIVGSINLKKEHIFGSVYFRFQIGFRVGSLLNSSRHAYGHVEKGQFSCNRIRSCVDACLQVILLLAIKLVF